MPWQTLPIRHRIFIPILMNKVEKETLTEWSKKYNPTTIDNHFYAELKKTDDEATIKHLINTLCVLGTIRAQTISYWIYVPPLMTALSIISNNEEYHKKVENIIKLPTTPNQADLYFCANLIFNLRRKRSYQKLKPSNKTTEPWSINILNAGIQYLTEEYLNENKKKIDYDFFLNLFFFFNATSYVAEERQHAKNAPILFPEKAREIARTFVTDEKIFVSYLHSSIQKRESPHYDGEEKPATRYQLTPHMLEYFFEKEEDFTKHLEDFTKLDDSALVKAYLEFYQQQRKNNNAPTERFNSDLLPLLNPHAINFDSKFEEGWLTL